jgi:hypothetical protein
VFTTGRFWVSTEARESVPLGSCPLADQEDLRLRFDVLTKTKEPQLHRYWTTRDRAANLRLFRLVSEVLRAIAAGAFPGRRLALPGLPLPAPPFVSR